MILTLILDNPKATMKVMMKTTGLSRRGVEYQINRLKDNGFIVRKGSDKGGFWEVTAHINTSDLNAMITQETVAKTVEEIIVELIRLNPKVTIKEMMQLTRLTRRGVEYNLNNMKTKGIIERNGPDKGGYWLLNTPDQSDNITE